MLTKAEKSERKIKLSFRFKETGKKDYIIR
jgi:hypothetical protein